MPDATRSGYFQEATPDFSAPVAPDTVEISDEEAVKVELPELEVAQEQQPELELDTDSSSDEDGVSSAKCGRAVTVPKAPPGFKLYQDDESHVAFDGPGAQQGVSVRQNGRAKT